jgi:hypothetical protein
VTRRLSTISRALLGPGRVMERPRPAPTPESKAPAQPVVGSQPIEPVEVQFAEPISDDVGAQEFISLLGD